MKGGGQRAINGQISMFFLTYIVPRLLYGLDVIHKNAKEINVIKG